MIENEAALSQAIYDNNIDEVKRLIKGGVDVNARHVWGLTPLIFAANLGHPEIVKLLIKKGANVDAKDEDGMTPLMFATHLFLYGEEANASDAEKVALYHDVKVRHTETVKILIAAEANVNDRDIFGRTALDYAINGGYNDVAKILLKRHNNN